MSCNGKLSKLLKNSIWIVPPETLTAYMYSENKPISVEDQTVWIINCCKNNYFFGNSYVDVNNQLTSYQLIGSVTPLGDVYITFYNNTLQTIGLGKFLKSKFIMQMSTPISNTTSGVTHWSYMIPVKKGDLYYENLPYANCSVPQFIEKFNKN